MPYEMITNSGHDWYEVSSAFQKSIRRGLVDDAIYWGTELDISGYGEYAWKRMRIMTSEDIGVAEPNLPANIAGLYSMWTQLKKKKDDKNGPERLFFVHAIILLAKAKKSRLVDNALIVMYEGRREKRQIPDYALDNHTRRGKAMGRGNEFFFETGAKLENKSEDVEDLYCDEALQARVGGFGKSLF